MSLSLTQNYSAVTPGCTFVQFVATGGSSPYVYSILPGGAGGSINASTGKYSAPPLMTAYPATGLYDTIQVTDALLATATAQILIGTPLFLFCNIIQKQMGLANDHIYLWDQKLFQPTDSDLYIAVSVASCKPYGNSTEFNYSGSGVNSIQYVSMWAMLDLDVISRGPAARDQKELVIAALQSVYSQQQQEANGFYIGKISTNFINLSNVDGAAIPYRFRISVALQYLVTVKAAVPYFNNFGQTMEYVNA